MSVANEAHAAKTVLTCRKAGAAYGDLLKFAAEGRANDRWDRRSVTLEYRRIAHCDGVLRASRRWTQKMNSDRLLSLTKLSWVMLTFWVLVPCFGQTSAPSTAITGKIYDLIWSADDGPRSVATVVRGRTQYMCVIPGSDREASKIWDGLKIDHAISFEGTPVGEQERQLLLGHFFAGPSNGNFRNVVLHPCRNNERNCTSESGRTPRRSEVRAERPGRIRIRRCQGDPKEVDSRERHPTSECFRQRVPVRHNHAE